MTGAWPGSVRACALLAASVLLVTGCGANNVRPRSVPLADAVRDTLVAGPESIVDLLRDAVTARGFTVGTVRAAEGFLETRWYDLTHQRPGGAYARDPTRAIRLRFFVDPVGESTTEIQAEATYLRTLDPSLPVREREVMVPPGSPGDTLLHSILNQIRAALGSPR